MTDTINLAAQRVADKLSDVDPEQWESIINANVLYHGASDGTVGFPPDVGIVALELLRADARVRMGGVV